MLDQTYNYIRLKLKKQCVLSHGTTKRPRQQPHFRLTNPLSSMRFCPICNNMYYLAISKTIPAEDIVADTPGEDILVHFCRRCNHEERLKDDKDDVVYVVGSESNALGDKAYENCINEYTKYDPTLLRVKDIKCCNETCDTNNDSDALQKREIVLVRYDDANMKYCCICATCDYTWEASNTA